MADDDDGDDEALRAMRRFGAHTGPSGRGESTQAACAAAALCLPAPVVLFGLPVAGRQRAAPRRRARRRRHGHRRFVRNIILSSVFFMLTELGTILKTHAGPSAGGGRRQAASSPALALWAGTALWSPTAPQSESLQQDVRFTVHSHHRIRRVSRATRYSAQSSPLLETFDERECDLALVTKLQS